MPSYKFTDAEPKTYELWPVADYRWRVTECEFSIINGTGPTNGSDAMELTFLFERKNPQTGLIEQKDVKEKFIFHEKTAWKVDQFAKSGNLLIAGKPVEKDQIIDWSEHLVVGLQGWATLGVEKYTSKRDNKEKEINKIISFITNKEKLAKMIDAPVEDAKEDDDLPF